MKFEIRLMKQLEMLQDLKNNIRQESDPQDNNIRYMYQRRRLIFFGTQVTLQK